MHDFETALTSYKKGNIIYYYDVKSPVMFKHKNTTQSYVDEMGCVVANMTSQESVPYDNLAERILSNRWIIEEVKK